MLAAVGASPAPLHGTIAYSTKAGDIWVMSADGSHRRQLTDSGSGFDFHPTWSPDGRRIAFQTTRGRLPSAGETNVFTIGASGSGERQLTTWSYGGSSPAWSPNGKWIAFGSANGLALLSPAGGKVTVLNRAGDCPSWAPDSTRIAYCAPRGGSVPPNLDVFETAILHPKARALRAGPASDFPGAWSPDGSQLAVYSGNPSSGSVWVVGTTARRVTSGAPSAWLRDGRLLVSRGGSWFLVRPDGSGVQRLPQLSEAISVAWHES